MNPGIEKTCKCGKSYRWYCGRELCQTCREAEGGSASGTKRARRETKAPARETAATKRHRRKASAEEGSALERARELRRTAEALGEELLEQRQELEEQIEEIDRMLEDLGLDDDGDEEAQKPKASARTVSVETQSAPRARPATCKHDLTVGTCKLCKDPARQRELDQLAQARPGDGSGL